MQDTELALHQKINPISMTARACLDLLSQAGDTHADALLQVLQFDPEERMGQDKTQSPELREQVARVLSGFSAVIELRYESSEKYIRSAGIRQVVDLPCGYTTRALRLAPDGYTYYGLDLPGPVSELAPAVYKLLSPQAREHVHFAGVDATNYASMRKALEGANGEILITTEGLLMYFTQDEVDALLAAVHPLLREFGGKLITMDLSLQQNTNAYYTALLGDSGGQSLQLIRQAIGASSQTDMYQNILFNPDADVVRAYIESQGFDLELVPLAEYLPDVLHSIQSLPEENRRAATEICRQMQFHVLTPRNTDTPLSHTLHTEFQVACDGIDHALTMHLSGRLDSMAAPRLLEAFQQASHTQDITTLTLDLEALEYVSSAGLRTLQMISAQLPDPHSMHIVHASPAVSKVLQAL